LILTDEASFLRAVRRKSLISLICLGCKRTNRAGERNEGERQERRVQGDAMKGRDKNSSQYYEKRCLHLEPNPMRTQKR